VERRLAPALPQIEDAEESSAIMDAAGTVGTPKIAADRGAPGCYHAGRADPMLKSMSEEHEGTP
jgi:hypothetical protein